MRRKRPAARRKTLEPQQVRSRESLQKLLRAATEVLGQHGVEGTTIPRIARHAGLTPGSVYRRFHDKEALLETAILGMMERTGENVRALTPEMAREIPLPVFADQIINSLVVGYRARAPLLRAMRQFVHSRAHTPFWKKASRVEIQTYEQLISLFLTHQERIKHPDPRIAVSTGLMMVISTVFELVVLHQDMTAWKDLLPKDDQALKRELTRAFLSYLGIEEPLGAAGKMEADTVAAINRWRERSSQNV
ncbi:MAG TPA: TetR/AcrR family transcriptional regulator [Candidatus Angelobacter sp.]|jgi:AcrR family transcriptional regulator|nr:TetR/AcrR family transcriptional regulator [Candidatus Angelobacter sp.]